MPWEDRDAEDSLKVAGWVKSYHFQDQFRKRHVMVGSQDGQPKLAVFCQDKGRGRSFYVSGVKGRGRSFYGSVYLLDEVVADSALPEEVMLILRGYFQQICNSEVGYVAGHEPQADAITQRG